MKFALTIVVVFLSLCVPISIIAQEPERHDVIVIGAGVSGLAAAKQLTETGYDVVVLEAQNRVGGRVLSDHYNNYALDLGASWIHGLNDNPLADLARDHGLELIIFDNEEAAVFFYSNGTKIDEKKIEELEGLYKEFKKSYHEKRTNLQKSGSDISLDAAFQEFSKNLSDEEKQYLDFEIVWNIESEWAADASDLSLRSFDKMGYKMDGRETIFPGGYDQIVKILEKDLDIRVQQTVKKIDYSKSDLITVGTDKGEDFEAKYVISTIPLGVLKKYIDTDFFSPRLPTWKNYAIEKLQMGVLNKVYFVFPNQFWDDVTWIVQIPKERGEWVYFANLVPLTKEPVLLAFLSGNYGREIEKKFGDDNEKIVDEGLKTLKTLYGEDNVPRPLYTNVTRWANNPYSFGSYSYTGVGATNAHYYDMSKPVEDRLFFAGEATEVRYPATVHGAYMSGIREALRIHAVNSSYPPPLNQTESGLLPEYVICKSGYSLVLKADSSAAACVEDSSKEAFQKTKWACNKDLDQILTKSENTTKSCHTSLLTYEGYEGDEDTDETEYED